MKNFIGLGDILTVTAPVAVESGGLVVVGSLVGVAVTDAASGEEVTINVQGVFSGLGITAAAGTAVHLSAGALNTTGTGQRVGVALGGGLVRLSGAGA
jgi:predicted RecA/RadA family phage recombinase